MHERRLPDPDRPTMRAVVQDRYGASDVLYISDVCRPKPGAREILVDVKASSVTAGDWRIRAAAFPGIFAVPGRIAFGLTRPRHRTGGTEFAGRVERVGDRVSRFKPLDRVFGIAGWGAHAERLCVSETSAVSHIPDCLTYEEAAVLPYGVLSALTFLRDLARLRFGESVLVVGASGGVGSYAVQVARALGGKVSGVCSSRNRELVHELGAEIVYDYGRDDVLCCGRQFDVILDTVGATTFETHRHLLTRWGRLACLEGSGRIVREALRTSRSRERRVVFGVARSRADELKICGSLVGSGHLRPVIDRSYTLDEIQDAHRYVEGRHRSGSVSVRIADCFRPHTPYRASNGSSAMQTMLPGGIDR